MLSSARERDLKKAWPSTLCDLADGSGGLVTEILAAGTLRRRLLDLGLVPGTKVLAVRRSPMGDPVAYKIRGTVIALRKEVADLVLIKPKL